MPNDANNGVPQRYKFGQHPWDYPALGLLAAMLLLLLLLIVTPATGATLQQTDHRDIVRAAKAQVINELRIDPDANGPNPAEPECPRWEIVWRTALMLTGEGAGLLEKTTGNRCRNFAVDIIAYRDGTIVDVLCGGNEGPSTPCWSVNPNKVDPARWRPAPDLPATPAPSSPPPVQGGEITAADLAALNAKLDALRDSILFHLDQLQQQGERNGEKVEHVEGRLNEIVAGAKVTGAKVLPWLALAASGACVAK